jgi:carboxylesterase
MSGISFDCKKLRDQEVALFQEAYQKYYLPGETKAPEIGAPYLLHQPVAKTGVLLIHGFMAAPHEVREWADNLFLNGYTVYAPRLAGHGTSAADLAAKNYTDWVDSVERGYKILSHCVERIIVAGFSTGAGLALHQAVTRPGRYRAVVSISAPMKFKGLSARLSETVEKWNQAAAFFNLNALQKPFAVNHPDNPEINYRRCPIHGFNQVKALMRNVYSGLPKLDVPALVIQGNKDPKVSPRAGRIIFQRISAAKKQYAEIDHPIHGIVRGQVGRRVFAVVSSFLSKLETD